MQYPSWRWWVAFLVVSGLAVGPAGCAAGDASADTRQPPAMMPVGPATAGAAAMDPGGMGTAGSGFGNSNVDVPDAPPEDPSLEDPTKAPDEEPDCGGVEVEPTVVMEVIPGNVLLVFDQSLSMLEAWSGSGNKWDVATQAVIGAIAPLQDQINAATLFFPNAGWDGCGVTAIDSGDQIPFAPGAQFTTAWTQYLANHAPSGFTPTGNAMQMADAALSSATLTGTTTVVVITDGDPNCGTDDAQVNQLAASWLAKGIKTHVFGLPGASDGTARLNALAAAGGTTQFLTPDDATALQGALAEIVGSSVSSSIDSCRIVLPSAPPEPDDITLAVVENGMKQSVARDLGDSGGWALDAAGLEITLQGALCDQAKAGTYSSISVVFGCADLPPLTPPPPVN